MRIVEGTPYLVRDDGFGWNVVRFVIDGGGRTVVVSGPFASEEAAERDAMRRWGAKSAKVYG